MPPPGVLVTGRLVEPHIAAGVDVDCPHHAQLAAAHAGEELEFGHRTRHRAKEGERPANRLRVHIRHPLGFAGAHAPALRKVADGRESVVNAARHQLFRDGPLEHAADPHDLLVDVSPAPRLADGLDGLGFGLDDGAQRIGDDRIVVRRT